MFFPLMKVLDLAGFLDLYYQAPNSWENRIRKTLFLNLIFSENSHWKCLSLGQIRHGEYRRITTNDFPEIFSKNSLAIVFPSDTQLEEKFEKLPTKSFWTSDIPQWRNTSGFYNDFTQVS